MANRTPAPETGTTPSDVVIDIVQRMFRQPGIADSIGAEPVLRQLQMAPIPLRAVIPIAGMITTASLLDRKRRDMDVRLVYIWLEAYFLGQEGAKNFRQMAKEIALEQLAIKTANQEIGDEAA